MDFKSNAFIKISLLSISLLFSNFLLRTPLSLSLSFIFSFFHLLSLLMLPLILSPIFSQSISYFLYPTITLSYFTLSFTPSLTDIFSPCFDFFLSSSLYLSLTRTPTRTPTQTPSHTHTHTHTHIHLSFSPLPLNFSLSHSLSQNLMSLTSFAKNWTFLRSPNKFRSNRKLDIGDVTVHRVRALAADRLHLPLWSPGCQPQARNKDFRR